MDLADLDGEIINWSMPDSGEVDAAAVRDALQIVAANVGVVIAPRPLLKVLSKKLVEHRDIKGGTETSIALVWKKDEDSEEIQDFVGIARGRTRNSSRQQTVKLSAREKHWQNKPAGRGETKNSEASAGKKTSRKTAIGVTRACPVADLFKYQDNCVHG